jgi:hypothetical protein
MESNGIHWNPMESTGIQWNLIESDRIHWIPMDSMLTNQLNILFITIPMDSMDSDMEVCGSVKY